MITVFYTVRPVEGRALVARILRERFAVDAPRFARGEHGKPRLENEQIFFSLSHSGACTAAAFSRREVGLDIELNARTAPAALFSRMTDRERQEDFLLLWTAKEAYVKYRGGTLAALLPRLRYEDGSLFFDGVRADVPLFQTKTDLFTLSIVGAGDVQLLPLD